MGSGSITQPPTGVPTITSVTTANGGSIVAQNTYIVVKGTKLVSATTPASGVIWSNAPSFLSGQMPTQLGGVSVTVNNKPAFVYFYTSAGTDPACAQDQLNILTPLDNTIGPVPVVITSGTVSTPPFFGNMQAVAPSFLCLAPQVTLRQRTQTTVWQVPRACILDSRRLRSLLKLSFCTRSASGCLRLRWSMARRANPDLCLCCRYAKSMEPRRV